MTTTELLDVAGLKRQVQNDAEFLAEQLGFFRQYYPSQLQQIQESIDNQDAMQVREWAHQLSGSLSNFHATVSRETAKSIEACGLENRLDEAAELNADLERQVVELCEAVESTIRDF